MSLKLATRILVVEDEVLIADFIQDLLLSEGYEDVNVVNSESEALAEFDSFKPEIVLMDINLNGKQKGIDLAQQINIEAQVIYLTAQNDVDTMSKAFATNPQAYLTKPIRKTDLVAAIQLIETKKKLDVLTVKSGYESIKIKQTDILFIKSENIYLDIKTLSKTYTVRMTLEKISQELNPQLFIKCHRSYIINKNYVTRKSSKSIFIDHFEIPLSRSATFEL